MSRGRFKKEKNRGKKRSWRSYKERILNKSRILMRNMKNIPLL
jgi:hypothetical protein